MRLLRRFVTVGVTALGAGALLFAAPQAATATPSDCVSVVDTDQAGAGGACFSGTGSYYLRIYCTDELRGSSAWFNGPRVGIGKQSFVDCPRSGGVQWIIEGPLSDHVKFHF